MTVFTAEELKTRLSDWAVESIESDLSTEEYAAGAQKLQSEWRKGLHVRFGSHLSPMIQESILGIAWSSSSDERVIEATYRNLVDVIAQAVKESHDSAAKSNE